MDGSEILGLIVIAYFVPAFVAWHRRHPQTKAIFALDLLLGWTFVGWVLALVWALTAIPDQQQRPQ